MARSIITRVAGQTAITRHVGTPPFDISLPAGNYEVDVGDGIWLPRTVTAAPAAGSYVDWTGPGWFDFSDASTLTLNSTAITGVANKRSGGGNLTGGGDGSAFQAVANAKNGRGIMRLTRNLAVSANIPRLDASASSLVSQLFQGDDKAYVAIAVYAPTDTNTHFVWSAGVLGPQNVALIRRSSTDSSVRKEVVASTTNDVLFPAQPSGTWRIVAIKNDGKTVTIWDNSLTPVVVSATQDVAAVNSTVALRIGGGFAANGPAAVQGNCDYGELLFESVKTNAEIQSAMSELSSKWAIPLT